MVALMARIFWHAPASLWLADEQLASDTLWGVVGVWADLRIKEQGARVVVMCSAGLDLYRRPAIPGGIAIPDEDLEILARKRPKHLQAK
jgi:hypothetical protein